MVRHSQPACDIAIGNVSSRCTLCRAEVTHTSGSRRTVSSATISQPTVTSARSISPCLARSNRSVLLHAFDIDRHQRMGAREARQDFGQEAVGIIVGRAEAQRAGEFGLGEGRHRLVIDLHDAPGIFDQPVAIGGEAAGAPVAGKQRPADQFLEPLHLHGNRRLGLVHLLGGAGEIAGIGNGEEGLQEVDIEIGDHGLQASINDPDGYYKTYSLD